MYRDPIISVCGTVRLMSCTARPACAFTVAHLSYGGPARPRCSVPIDHYGGATSIHGEVDRVPRAGPSRPHLEPVRGANHQVTGVAYYVPVAGQVIVRGHHDVSDLECLSGQQIRFQWRVRADRDIAGPPFLDRNGDLLIEANAAPLTQADASVLLDSTADNPERFRDLIRGCAFLRPGYADVIHGERRTGCTADSTERRRRHSSPACGSGAPVGSRSALGQRESSRGSRACPHTGQALRAPASTHRPVQSVRRLPSRYRVRVPVPLPLLLMSFAQLLSSLPSISCL